MPSPFTTTRRVEFGDTDMAGIMHFANFFRFMEAAGRLKASKAARGLFGDAFVDHYSATREWEEREFRKAITEWELDRYMELI